MGGKFYSVLISQHKKDDQCEDFFSFCFPAQRQQPGAEGQEKPSVSNGRAQRRSECKSLIIFVSRWTHLLSDLVTAWQIL